MNRYFFEVNPGEHFERGGNLWVKKSSRTAQIVASNIGSTIHTDYAGKRFYFTRFDSVNSNAVFWNLYFKENTINF
jgi:hypothetical protein